MNAAVETTNPVNCCLPCNEKTNEQIRNRGATHCDTSVARAAIFKFILVSVSREGDVDHLQFCCACDVGAP